MYGAVTLFGWPFHTILLPIRFLTPIRNVLQPRIGLQCGLGFSPFARHY